MRFLKKQLITVFLTFSLLGIAQKSAVYTNDLQDYQKALTLYNNKQYNAAQSLFDDSPPRGPVPARHLLKSPDKRRSYSESDASKDCYGNSYFKIALKFTTSGRNCIITY